MTTAILILIGIILILALAVFILFKYSSNLKKDIKEKNSVIDSLKYNNRELRKTLQKLNTIEEEGVKKIEKIKNTPDSDIADILNNQLSNTSDKS